MPCAAHFPARASADRIWPVRAAPSWTASCSTSRAAPTTRTDRLARRRNVALEGALTWAFTFVDQPWFAGYRQLATHGVDLPVLNVFRLFSRLGAEQIAATSSGQVDLNEIVSSGVGKSPDVGVLATRGDNGRVQILLWHYRDDDLPGPVAEVALTVAGLAPAFETRARAWRIDRTSGNAYASWLAMGSPASPTQRQVDRLLRSARMSARQIRIQRGNAGALLVRHLPLQSVELIEIDARQR
jgi:xylan 1,4-beta-xylosidase